MKDPKENLSINILGVDYGETNIGLALGNNGVVAPLKVIPGNDLNSAAYAINKIIVENNIKTIVLGIPLTAENKETRKSIIVRRFSKLLKTVTKRPVVFQNEYGSSIEALNEALTINISRKKRKSNDHLAAALILKMYYSEFEKE